MKKLTLMRVFGDDQGSVGVLMNGRDRICFINELPWKENRSNVSCIPKGTYKVKYLARSGSGRYRRVYHVGGVANRSGILIHAGNYAGATPAYKTHSHGCLLPATRWGKLNGQRAGLASRAALNKLRSLVGESGFILEIL